MPSPAIHPSVPYIKELSSLGHGCPLWIPEGAHESKEVEIGDIGYITDEGAFMPLLNISGREKRDDGLDPFSFTEDNGAKPTVYKNYLRSGPYTSRSLRESATEGSLQAYVASIIFSQVAMNRQMCPDGFREAVPEARTSIRVRKVGVPYVSSQTTRTSMR